MAKKTEQTEVVGREVAEKDVIAWLDYKKIGKKKRQNEAEDGHSDEVEELIEAIQEGILSIDTSKDFEITHKLKFPVVFDHGETAFDKLTYKARLQLHEINTKMKGVKSNDGDGRVLSYKAALTDKPKGMLNKMDSVDNSISNAIVLFFI